MITSCLICKVNYRFQRGITDSSLVVKKNIDGITIVRVYIGNIINIRGIKKQLIKMDSKPSC